MHPWHSWPEVLLSNAIVATLLALVVSIAMWFPLRPAARHVLWLIVLLKLVTPPLVRFELPWAITPGSAREAKSTVHDPQEIPRTAWMPSPQRVLDSAGSFDGAPLIVSQWTDVTHIPVVQLISEQATRPAKADPAQPVSSNPPTIARLWTQWAWLLGVIWLAGSLTWYILAGIRLQRFYRRALSLFPGDSRLQEIADDVAQKLGLQASPPVRMTEANLPPMLGSLLGRNVIVLPRHLVETLTLDQQAAILAHELAHYRRGDHWTRWIEFVVIGLYWWHPVAWHARKQLQDAEELCCDAWVMRVFPDRAKCYAQALLTTVDFLADNRSPAPAGASAFGPVQSLKRRLQMILSRRHSPELPALAKTALLALGLSVLPWAPRVFSQDLPPSAAPAAEAAPLAPTATPPASTAEAASLAPTAAAVPPATTPQAPLGLTPDAATPPVEPATPSVGAAPPTAATPPAPTATPSNPLRDTYGGSPLSPTAALPSSTAPSAQAASSSEARLDRLERMLEQLIQERQKPNPMDTGVVDIGVIDDKPVAPRSNPAVGAGLRVLPEGVGLSSVLTPMANARANLEKLDGEIGAIDEQIRSVEKQLGDLHLRRKQVIKASAKRERLNYGDDVNAKTELFVLQLGDYYAVVGHDRQSGTEVFEVDLETLGGIQQIRRDKALVVLIGKNGREVVLDLNAGRSLNVPISEPQKF